MQIRNDQAAHNFITILPKILHFCLMTLIKNEDGSLFYYDVLKLLKTSEFNTF